LSSKSCLLQQKQLLFLTLLQLPQSIVQPRWLLVTWLSWSWSCPYLKNIKRAILVHDSKLKPNCQKKFNHRPKC
jgi:hypothetical protein